LHAFLDGGHILFDNSNVRAGCGNSDLKFADLAVQLALTVPHLAELRRDEI
jgi:hypothetical protein